jgi:hypothetical protein
MMYVSSLYYGRDLLQHMRLHGVTEPEDYISKAMQGKSSQKMTPVKAENRTEEVSDCAADVEGSNIGRLKFPCIECLFKSFQS